MIHNYAGDKANNRIAMKKILLYAMIACVTAVMPKAVNAAEAYAALSNDNTTLTFYFDDEKSSRNGMDIGPFERAYERGWDDYRETISIVVFDSSFRQYDDLTSTSIWFKIFRNLIEMKGIENLKTSNVTDMSGMFDECFSLQSLDISHFDTRTVKDMDGMFAGCKAIRSLDVSGFITDNVTTMYSMFEGCEAITSLNVSSFNTSNVTRMTCMFADCHKLSELDLSSFNTSNVTSMGRMFRGDSLLTTVFVSNGWSTAKVEKGDDMFKGCTSLVGGSGTLWDENHTDYSYAHIDGGAGNPGYLTYKDAGAPAGIKTTRETDSPNAECYNLNGMKLTGNPDKDIYIRNGKKYMKK